MELRNSIIRSPYTPYSIYLRGGPWLVGYRRVLWLLLGASVTKLKEDFRAQLRAPYTYLEGHGDLISVFIVGITRVTIWVIDTVGAIDLLTMF